MGVHPSKAIEAVPVAEDIYAFLDSAYAPQPLPGVIDENLALAGSVIYSTECSACHGAYDTLDGRPELVSFSNWLGDVGTDPLRAAAFTEGLANTFQDTPYHDQIAAAHTGGYVAPPLDGIWSSAPYLHNGSIPTIWHLLTPEARPETFELGGHMLDFTRLGLRLQDGRYPEGYVPFSQPVILDTTQPGLGNDGHDFGATLSDVDKSALMEFLKQL
jgi:mono/diheme cytochrome c family protein